MRYCSLTNRTGGLRLCFRRRNDGAYTTAINVCSGQSIFKGVIFEELHTHSLSHWDVGSVFRRPCRRSSRASRPFPDIANLPNATYTAYSQTDGTKTTATATAGATERHHFKITKFF